MNSSKAIGGYFSLELPSVSNPNPVIDGIYLNTARNALEYILEAVKPSKVYMPLYICDVMLEPFEKTNTKYEFYGVNEQLEMAKDIELKDNELILYVNYFGIKSDYCHHLIDTFGDKVIIDASQAFYYRQHASENILYSPRKFFGIPDGGVVVTKHAINRQLPSDESLSKLSHLIKRHELEPEAGYGDFQVNDKKLEHQPIRTMAPFTLRLMQSIDYTAIQKRRIENFTQLHTKLQHLNKLNFDQNNNDTPMVYPLLIENGDKLRDVLVKNRIFVATYWPNIFSWADEGDTEYGLAKNLLPLPIDQRYDGNDMERILEVIHEYIN